MQLGYVSCPGVSCRRSMIAAYDPAHQTHRWPAGLARGIWAEQEAACFAHGSHVEPLLLASQGCPITTPITSEPVQGRQTAPGTTPHSRSCSLARSATLRECWRAGRGTTRAPCGFPPPGSRMPRCRQASSSGELLGCFEIYWPHTASLNSSQQTSASHARLHIQGDAEHGQQARSLGSLL